MTNDNKCLIYNDNGDISVLATWLGNWMTPDEALSFNDLDMDAYATDNGWDGWDPECLEVVAEVDLQR